MKPKPLPKPAWLLYAEQVRVEIDNIPPNKSGKREERAIYAGWLTAKNEHGYQGSERDWNYLLHHLGRKKA